MGLESNLTLKYRTVQNYDGVGIVRVSQIQAPSQWDKATLKAVLGSIVEYWPHRIMNTYVHTPNSINAGAFYDSAG